MISPPPPGRAALAPRRGAELIGLLRLSSFLLASLLQTLPLVAQSDSATVTAVETAMTDPARSRLLWMSTGRVMPGGVCSFGVFELVVLQGGYGLADVAQINASGTIGYFSIGSKFQILPPDGLFQGIAVGVDAGFTQESGRLLLPRGGLYALNLAVSVGSEDLQLHLNGIRAYPFGRLNRPVTYLQLGCSAVLQRTPSEITTLLGELWMYESSYPTTGFNPFVIPVGIRHASRRYTFEIAVMILPAVLGNGRSGFPIVPLPYIGFQWFF